MKHFTSLLFVAALAVAGSVHAQSTDFSLSIKDHQFSPTTLEVPAGQKLKILVKNLDSTPEEFDSDDLHREKLVPAGKEITITVGPLKPGTYKFKGDFHPKTAQGTLVVQ